MEQSRRHLHVADLTCLHCTEKDAELERVREMLRIQAEKQTGLMEEVAGAMESVRAMGKELAAKDDQIRYWKGELTKADKKAVSDEKIDAVIAHWMHHRPRTKPESFPEGGKRRKMIAKALELMREADVGDVAALCEAIDGVHIAPWERYGKRAMHREDEKSVLRNRWEDVLADEGKIEKCRAVRRWAVGDDADRAWELWQVAMSTETAMACVVLEKLGEQRFRREEPAEWCFVDGARTRLDDKGTRSE